LTKAIDLSAATESFTLRLTWTMPEPDADKIGFAMLDYFNIDGESLQMN
jgi:hypothetical protein